MAWKEILPVAVVLKGSRLSKKPIDYMAIFDAVLFLSPDPWKLINDTLSIPDFQVLHVKPHFYSFSDKAAVYGIDIMKDPNSA